MALSKVIISSYSQLLNLHFTDSVHGLLAAFQVWLEEPCGVDEYWTGWGAYTAVVSIMEECLLAGGGALGCSLRHLRERLVTSLWGGPSI